jgi:phosphoribosylanthranilate isomerase
VMVKICGITNLEDALVAAEGGASALGFNFYAKSPRYLTQDAAVKIIEALPDGVWKVGVFVNEAPETVASVAAAVGLDVVQLHGEEPPGSLPRGLRVWKAFRAGPGFDPARLEAYDVEAFLLDSPSADTYGGTGHTFDWSLAAGLNKKIVLAGGLDENNVRAAIRSAKPWGVDACSKLESAPGRKDHGKVARFLKAALSENME